MIALPVAARAGEQPSTNREQSHRPQPSATPRPVNNRTATPSVSPLSNASVKDSNVAHEDHDLEPLDSSAIETEEQNNVPHNDVAVATDQDDDRSSSLSEFEGSFDDQDKPPVLHDSAARPAQEDDSEAETERLQETPRKVTKNADLATHTGRTPSRLREEATLDDELSEPETSPEPPEDVPISPTKTRAAIGQPSELAGRKRKRTSPLSDADSPLSDEPDIEELSPKKRNVDSGANGLLHAENTLEEEEIEEDAELDENAAQAAEEQSPEPVETRETTTITKSGRGRRGKSKAPQRRELGTAILQSHETQEADAEELDELPDEDENDLSTSVKSEEELERKNAATRTFSTIAEHFKAFTKKLHAERLGAVEAELAMITAPNATHPELLGMIQCITTRRDTKIQQEMKLHHYKMQALKNKTVAERSQLHSQYFQEARDIRENVLYELGKQWYHIQKDRRTWYQEEQDKRMYRFPAKRSDQVRQQAKYNREVSILAGVAKYVGFPAAPEIEGAKAAELDDDLKAMKIPRRQPQPLYDHHPYNQHVPVQNAPNSARLAEEKFLEQTPWANPQHPSHRQSHTPASYTPNMGNPNGAPWQSVSSSSLFLRQVSAQGQRNGSPFTTPFNAQKRMDQNSGPGSGETIGASDPPSSVQAAPPTTDRIQLIPFDRMDASPSDQMKARAAVMPGGAARTLADKRDFSGLSSASTIETPNDAADDNRASHAMNNNIPPVPPYLHTEQSAPNQAFATSAIHAQHGEDRRSELYESVDMRRRLGAFGTPLPLAGAGLSATADGREGG